MNLPQGYLRFSLKMLFLSLICGILAVIALNSGLLQLPISFVLSPLLLFFILGLLLHYFFFKALLGKPQLFISIFMGGQALKMFVHLMVLVLVAFSFPDYAIHFILLYAVYYLVYTIAEVINLGQISRKQQEID